MNFAPSGSTNCEGHAVSVGSYSGGDNPYGALDLAGNVWEWVADWFDSNYYANSPASNPTGPGSGTYRSMRGGSWMNTGGFMRTTLRGMNKPDRTYNWLGFRCAANP